MKVAALVSGGVDSSVALALAKEQGHDVTAFYLKIWLEDDISYLGECPWEEDLEYVKKVCQKLDVPLQVINLQKEYWNNVVSYVIDEVKKGRTPNPDILCNSRIKFKAFFEHIDDSYEKIISGHYADIQQKNNTYYLKRVPDQIKDQTYFLSHLTQTQLQRISFPLGKYTKNEVRTLAQKFDLPNKDRKDSQGICFLGKIKYTDFLQHYLGIKKGDIIEYETGKKLGFHNGSWLYTIGQRKGIGSGLNHGPWYVVQKDHPQNIVYISNSYKDIVKDKRTFRISNCNWIPKKPSINELKVKLRHGQQMHSCTIEEEIQGTYVVTIKEPDQGIASGQFAVFYDDTYCYGGGIIE
ncbi:MAG: tRNA 2-thiouridine(34) synthase MnmA [Candidatus Woesearchaeota archaeon]